MWSNIKKQKEDKFQYGGERRAAQVLANSFIPSVVSIIIILLKNNIINVSTISIEFIESSHFLFIQCRLSFIAYCIIVLYRVLCWYVGKWSGYYFIQAISLVFALEACSCRNKRRYKCFGHECFSLCQCLYVYSVLVHSTIHFHCIPFLLFSFVAFLYGYSLHYLLLLHFWKFLRFIVRQYCRKELVVCFP